MTNTVVLERLPIAPGDTISDLGKYERQRIYIFVSRQGFLFAGLLLVMLLGAVNYSNSMAYVLTFLLGSLLMVCILHTYRNLRGIIISSAPASPVFAGELLRLPLLFDNRHGLKRIALAIEPAPKGRKKKRRIIDTEPLAINLDTGKIKQEHLLILAQKRGYLHPGRLKIISSYPLGLFKTWSYIEPEQICIIYPKPAGNPQLPIFTEYDTEEQIGKNTGTDDFTGFKPYRHGDSIRNIDWKAFAKEQPLQVKLFSGSGARKLIISWEFCGQNVDEERRLSQLCLWVLEAEKKGFHYGLEIPGTYIDLGNGDIHLQKCLITLARYGFADN